MTEESRENPIPASVQTRRLRFLRRNLRRRSVERGSFQLSQGATTDVLIDVSRSLFCADFLGHLCYALAYTLRNVEYDVVLGVETGGIALSAAFVQHLYVHEGRSVEGGYVRKVPKTHGKRNTVEGFVPRGARVVLLDDVVTTGDSVSRACAALYSAIELQARVVAIRAVVDRGPVHGHARAHRLSSLCEGDYQFLMTLHELLEGETEAPFPPYPPASPPPGTLSHSIAPFCARQGAPGSLTSVLGHDTDGASSLSAFGGAVLVGSVIPAPTGIWCYVEPVPEEET